MTAAETKWKKRDWLGLCVVPLEFIIGTAVAKLPALQGNTWALALSTIAVFVAGFIVMLILFGGFLKQQWREYKKSRIILKLLLNAALAAGAFLLLGASRGVLKAGGLSAGLTAGLADTFSAQTAGAMTYSSIGLMLVGSLQPFIAPFAEELTFRHLLYWRVHPKWFKVIMFFASSILFGLIHINNFGGDVSKTIPYMVIGAYFALIYTFTKNIWGSLMTHWMFNTVNSILPALFMLVMKVAGVI